MDPKEIRELIELISRSNFASFELEGDDFTLKLVKEQPAAQAGPAQVEAASPRPAPPPQASAEAKAAGAAAEESEESGGEDGTVLVRSPIVGTFYRASSPEKPSFVDIGAKVKKGQVM